MVLGGRGSCGCGCLSRRDLVHFLHGACAFAIRPPREAVKRLVHATTQTWNRPCISDTAVGPCGLRLAALASASAAVNAASISASALPLLCPAAVQPGWIQMRPGEAQGVPFVSTCQIASEKKDQRVCCQSLTAPASRLARAGRAAKNVQAEEEGSCGGGWGRGGAGTGG